MGSSLHMLAVLLFILTSYLPYFIFMGWYLYSVKPTLALSIVIIFIPVALTQLLRTGIFSKLEDESAPLRREYEYYERCICHREYFKETRILALSPISAGCIKTHYIYCRQRNRKQSLGQGLWNFRCVF